MQKPESILEYFQTYVCNAFWVNFTGLRIIQNKTWSMKRNLLLCIKFEVFKIIMAWDLEAQAHFES